MKDSGAIVWEGSSPYDGSPIVMIVTGITGKASSNRKTGEMVQTWILRADMSPMDAIRAGSDSAICGACPLRGSMVEGKRIGRACYVNVGQAPSSVWRKYARGGYPRMTPSQVSKLIAGKGIRLGAYGDPAMVPLRVLTTLTAHARMWTGYTHQWRTISKGYARLLMASADSVADRRQARARGYRSFYVVPVTASLSDIDGAIECAATRTRAPKTCVECGACAGTRRGAAPNAVDIVILAHGAGSKHVA